MNKYLILFILLITLGCAKNPTVITNTVTQTVTLTEVEYVERQVVANIYDSNDVYLNKMYKQMQDTLKLRYKNDSIQFRKYVIKINGGLNGWTERYRMWMYNRKSLKLYPY